MGWYEALKDGIIIAQKADNVPLVNELIEAQKQILDLIAENTSLKEVNKKLNVAQELEGKVERHIEAYIT